MTMLNKLRSIFKKTPKPSSEMNTTSDSFDSEMLGDPEYRYWSIGRYMPEGLMNSDTQVYINQTGVLTMMMFYLWNSCKESENHLLGFRLEVSSNPVYMYSNGNLIPSYGFVYGVADSLEAFKKWEANYLARFAPTREGELLPSLPNSFNIRGTAFDHNGILYNENKKYLELKPESFKPWIWIVQNCKGKVFVTDKSFIFEDDHDAVLFKLQYLPNEQEYDNKF
jgi:hypothetical protein